MSKPFDYSKWDNIELSDDEDDVHPNIDKESWFRMKHRSRVEREEREEKDTKKINDEMAKANLRIKEINKILSRASAAGSDSDDSDDDLEDLDGLRSELEALTNSNADGQAKLDHYEKNKKWNVDNMFHVVEERTIVNENVGEKKFSESGYALPEELETTGTASAKGGAKTEAKKAKQPSSDEGDDGGLPTEKMSGTKIDDGSEKKTTEAKSSSAAAPETTAITASKTTPKPPQLQPQPDSAMSVSVSMLSYHEFTEKYADVVEKFMALQSMDRSRDFLIQHGNVLLQENASNYLLLASLEDEMNGFHEKMKLVARQSQIISNIAELAKSLKLHPGNVIHPFFARMQKADLYAGFMEGVDDFVKRIEVRAVQKKKEMDEERAQEVRERGAKAEGTVDMSDIPREQRLGPGGLDPLEVFDTLPESMQVAFESRERGQLEKALRDMKPEDMEYHMDRCIAAGLWNS